MAEVLELDDLFYSYPSQYDPLFQTKITSKQEFKELSAPKREETPKRGGFYTHQKLIHRFLQQYDRLFLIHRAGTGKTCSTGGFTEKVKRSVFEETYNYINDYIEGESTYIKKVFWLVKGDSTMEETRRQLTCFCSNAGDYETKSILQAKDQKRARNKELSKFYDIRTYYKFIQYVNTIITSDKLVEEELSGCIFVVDEVQNIRIDPLTLSRAHIDNADDEDLKDPRRLVQTYNTLHKVFHTAKRSKVILMSATPAINTPREIPMIMNLLLPLDMQMRTDENSESYYQQMSLQDIKKYFEPYISYLIEQESPAEPIFTGKHLPALINCGNTKCLDFNSNQRHTYDVNNRIYQSQLVLNYSIMSEFQYAWYMQTVSNSSEFKTKQRQASLFVFPDGSVGEQGFKKYITKREDGGYDISPELLYFIQDLDRLRLLSSKYADAIQTIKETNGVCFVFMDFRVGGGAILFGLCLAVQGFTQYSPSGSPFKTTTGKESTALCVRDDETMQFTAPKIPSSYAILETGPKQGWVLDTLKAPQNYKGNYLKVLIGTPLSREGLNLAHVVNIDIMGPGWNEANNYQALRRGIRATSHDVLILKLKEQAIAEGKNPNDVHVEIKVNLRTAIGPNNETSVDIEIYEIAERKNIEISNILRKMKQSAFDCQINKNRNTLSPSNNYKSECDYDICKYVCADPPPTQIDYSSYNVLYANDIIKEVQQQLKVVFNYKSQTSYRELFKLLNEFSEQFIVRAVQNMIINNVAVVNQYGQRSYIYVDNGAVYLKVSYPGVQEQNILADGYYNENLIGIVNIDLETAYYTIDFENQKQLLEKIRNIDPKSPEFNELYKQLNLKFEAGLLENAVIFYYINGQSNALSNYILNKYKNNLFALPEPVEAIQSTAEILSTRGRGQGRKASEDKQNKVDVDRILQLTPIPAIGQSEIVYLHDLYTRIKQRSAHGSSSRINEIKGTLRILKPSEQIGWRDVTEYEYPIYSNHIKKKLLEIGDKFQQQSIYGIYDPTKGEVNGFKLVTPDHQNGRVAKSYKFNELVNILYYFNIPPPTTIPTYFNRQQLMTNIIGSRNYTSMSPDLLQQFNDQQLLYFNAWRDSTKTDMSLAILRYMQSRDDLLQVI